MKSKELIINNENTIGSSNNESNESIIDNESIINNESNRPNESIIYDPLKEVGNVLEKSTINSNLELMNNSLKTIKTLETIISLKKQSNTDNTLVKQLNTDNTLIEQSNTDNTLIEQSNTNKTNDTFVTLPKWLKDLRCITNPINNKKGDNKCFQYSIGLFKHKKVGTNYNRISKIKPFLKNFNFDNVNYPIKKRRL